MSSFKIVLPLTVAQQLAPYSLVATLADFWNDFCSHTSKGGQLEVRRKNLLLGKQTPFLFNPDVGDVAPFNYKKGVNFNALICHSF